MHTCIRVASVTLTSSAFTSYCHRIYGPRIRSKSLYIARIRKSLGMYVGKSVPDVGFDMYCKVECGKVDYKLKLKFNFCSRDALLNMGLREDFMSSFMISAFEMVYSSKVQKT